MTRPTLTPRAAQVNYWDSTICTVRMEPDGRLGGVMATHRSLVRHSAPWQMRLLAVPSAHAQSPAPPRGAWRAGRLEVPRLPSVEQPPWVCPCFRSCRPHCLWPCRYDPKQGRKMKACAENHVNHSRNDAAAQAERQGDPHSHAIVLEPSRGNMAFVPDLGMDVIRPPAC